MRAVTLCSGHLHKVSHLVPPLAALGQRRFASDFILPILPVLPRSLPSGSFTPPPSQIHRDCEYTHLPPSLSPVVRRSECQAVADLLLQAPRGEKIIAGDLNDTIRQRGGGWLSKCLQLSGMWSGFNCPYVVGSAPNIVPTPRGTSREELDWVLISPDTPCTGCTKSLLRGLCTHLALQCDLGIPAAGCCPVDPSGGPSASTERR